MKSKISNFLFALLLCGQAAQPVFADQVASLDTRITADKYATLNVKEEILVRFDADSRFLERQIPIKTSGFKLVTVCDENNRPCYFQIKQGTNMVTLRIARGEPKRGQLHKEFYTYKIEYLVRRAFSFSDSGSDLKIPIAQADAPYAIDSRTIMLTVPKGDSSALPSGVSSAAARNYQTCNLSVSWSDQNGKVLPALVSSIRTDVNKNSARIFATDLGHSPTNLYAVFHVPKGIIQKPGPFIIAGQFAVDWYPIFLLPLLCLFGLISTWYNFGARKGHDKSALVADTTGGVEMPAPIALAALIRGRSQSKQDLASELVWLILSGHLRLDNSSGYNVSEDSSFAGLTSTGKDRSALNPFAISCLEAVEKSEFDLTVLKDLADKSIQDEEIFWGKAGSFTYAATALGVGLVVGGLLLTAGLSYLPAGPWGLGVLACGFVSLLMARFMPVFTFRGLKMRAQARKLLLERGFKNEDLGGDGGNPAFTLDVQNLKAAYFSQGTNDADYKDDPRVTEFYDRLLHA